MRLTKKDAKILFQQFVDAKQAQKAKLWDKLVPYANTYPELYYEIVGHPKHSKPKQEKVVESIVKSANTKLVRLF